VNFCLFIVTETVEKVNWVSGSLRLLRGMTIWGVLLAYLERGQYPWYNQSSESKAMGVAAGE